MGESARHMLHTWPDDQLYAHLAAQPEDAQRAWLAELSAEIGASLIPPAPPPEQWYPGKAAVLRRLLTAPAGGALGSDSQGPTPPCSPDGPRRHRPV